MRKNLHWWMVPVLLAPAILSSPMCFNKVLLFRDILQFFIPAQAMVANAIHSGHFPAWNALLYGGTPLLAEPDIGLFYPPNLVFEVLPLHVAATAYVLLHLPLAGLGAYLLARAVGFSTPASAFAGTGFVSSGYVLSMHGAGIYLSSAALLPLALALIVRLVKVPSRRNVAVAALPIAALVFNGEPQTLMFVGILGLLWALAESDSQSRVRGLGAVGLAHVLGIGLGMLQLIPTVILTAGSTRAKGVSFAESATWSLSPQRWLEFVAPSPFGLSYPNNGYWGALWEKSVHAVPWAPSLYLGTFATLSLVAVPWRSLGAGLRMWAVAGGMALLLAVGTALPVYGWWYSLVPLANRFRYPEKFSVVVTLVGVLVGSSALDAAAQLKRRAWWFAGFSAFWAAAATVVFAVPDLFAKSIAVGLQLGAATATVAQANDALAISFLHSAIICGLLALAWISLSKRLAPAVVGLALFDGVFVGIQTLSFGDGSFFATAPPLVEELRRTLPADSTGRIYRDRSCTYPGSGHQGTLLERVRRWEWETGKENFLTLFGIGDIVGYGAAESQSKVEIFRAMRSDDPLRALRLFGAAARITCRPDGSPEVAPVPDPLPRSFVARGVQVAASDVITRLRDPSFDPRFEALVTQPVTPASEIGSMMPELSSSSPEEVKIKALGPGVLVLVDSFANGWTAKRDGQTTPILAVDGLWRGVELPEGEHAVTFSYETPGLRLGASLTMISFLLLLLLVWRPHRLIP